MVRVIQYTLLKDITLYSSKGHVKNQIMGKHIPPKKADFIEIAKDA